MIFLETSFIINFHVLKIQNHERSKEIWEDIEDKEMAISEMVIYETLTVLRKLNQNNKKLKEVHDFLVNSQNIKVFEDVIYYEKALKETFINPVGFFDNLSHVVMLANSIKEIASFDKDFDIFEDIKRIY
ncbi:type II toxin-antitoxin system VapC family toxin [Methanobrevibacter curvatus]|uniref:tRNA(FMet)-specific endonuclease VapC n=1 Tax=Methanobrevibacter curvatus TaxID=49547 RepID=A0A162FEB1_9EURY|nr:type II toxin-antitoxin system VapC family toxin [Methanobrevibacter curvatus]KZX11775.1 tRNA(fMet)-specific endonuclease VapC [Methanobrevibacter curvatus]